MPDHDSDIKRDLDRLFRRENGRLVAFLVRKLGPPQLALAEDIAQDALLSAARTWPYGGLPDNPAAWLQRTAMNRAIDLLRHNTVRSAADPDLRLHHRSSAVAGHQDELALMMLCCHPALSVPDRLALALNVAMGFSSKEIAGLLLVRPAAMAARLTRAKQHIKDRGAELAMPGPTGQVERHPSVLRVLYLSFSLGFSPASGDRAVREDTAFAALALTEDLAYGAGPANPDIYALAALLSLQASRLAARTDSAGQFVPISRQDRSLWDQALIARGLRYLAKATAADQLSPYHVEAGIAALHATAAPGDTPPWDRIANQYALLEDMTASPVVMLNRAVAQAMAGDLADAKRQLMAAQAHAGILDQAHFWTAKAEILRVSGEKEEAAAAYRKALSKPATGADILHLEARLKSLAASTSLPD